tara:strand:+ start:372 stop:545 length:174 start_codon:yes stop_codon:yes gene_type:complete
MVFKNAQYIKGVNDRVVAISAVADGKNVSIPIVIGNRYYDEIKKQLDAGTLTIKDAE